MFSRSSYLGVVIATAVICPLVAKANDFYAGKQITLVVSAGAGGGYGAVGQIVSRHLPRFIKGNPTMVPSYMSKAGGLAAANYL